MGSNHFYKIVLADDHILVRRGIKKIIEETNGMKVIGEAGDGLELLEILEKYQPDLVVVDIAMPRLRGLEAARRVKNLYPEIKVLILSMHRSKEYLLQAIAAGVDGYVLKEDADTALHTAIQEIRRGKTLLFAALIGIALDKFGDQTSSPGSCLGTFSFRDHPVIRLFNPPPPLSPWSVPRANRFFIV